MSTQSVSRQINIKCILRVCFSNDFAFVTNAQAVPSIRSNVRSNIMLCVSSKSGNIKPPQYLRRLLVLLKYVLITWILPACSSLAWACGNAVYLILWNWAKHVFIFYVCCSRWRTPRFNSTHQRFGTC